jgi:EmrB/QacA subfamily drug resistance transporter
VETRWKILLIISVGSFMAFLDAPIVSVAFPALQKTFATTSPTTLAWVIDAYFVSFAAFLVIGGKLADRFGRRRIFLAGMWLFALASAACGLASSAETLIAARAIQALGGAFVVPAGQALMLEAFPAEERRKAIAILAALIAVATSLAPTAGAVIVEGPGWRWIFYVNVFVGLAAIAAAISVLEHDRPDHDSRMPDALGVIVQVAALSFLVLAILKTRQWGLGDPRTVAAYGLALVGLAVFVQRCQRHPAPVLNPELFRSRAFTTANLASAAFALALYAGTINSVLYLTGVWGLSIIVAGLAFAPAAIVSVLAGAPAGWLMQRYDPRVISAVGALVAATGLAMIALNTGANEDFLADWLPGQVAYTAGIVIGLSGVVGTALTSAPPAQFALASGINAALRQVGGAIGVAIALAVIGDSIGLEAMRGGHTVFLIGAASLCVGAVLALLMGPARKPETAEAALASEQA